VTPIVCMITDRRRLADPRPDAVVRQIRQAVARGIQLVQIRERDLEGRALYDLSRQAVDAVKGSTTRVIVNDRLDVALAAGAHGVQLRAGSFSASRVRTLVPTGFLIGQSVHSISEAAAARAADFLLYGTVFETGSKPGVAAAGLEQLSAVVQSTAVPVLAVGGVSTENMPQVLDTGAAGVAGISLFTELARP
jgi:thiamine-phosphate diphosphorylase